MEEKITTHCEKELHSKFDIRIAILSDGERVIKDDEIAKKIVKTDSDSELVHINKTTWIKAERWTGIYTYFKDSLSKERADFYSNIKNDLITFIERELHYDYSIEIKLLKTIAKTALIPNELYPELFRLKNWAFNIYEVRKNRDAIRNYLNLFIFNWVGIDSFRKEKFEPEMQADLASIIQINKALTIFRIAESMEHAYDLYAKLRQPISDNVSNQEGTLSEFDKALMKTLNFKKG